MPRARETESAVVPQTHQLESFDSLATPVNEQQFILSVGRSMHTAETELTSLLSKVGFLCLACIQVQMDQHTRRCLNVRLTSQSPVQRGPCGGKRGCSERLVRESRARSRGSCVSSAGVPATVMLSRYATSERTWDTTRRTLSAGRPRLTLHAHMRSGQVPASLAQPNRRLLFLFHCITVPEQCSGNCHNPLAASIRVEGSAHDTRSESVKKL